MGVESREKGVIQSKPREPLTHQSQKRGKSYQKTRILSQKRWQRNGIPKKLYLSKPHEHSIPNFFNQKMKKDC